MAKFDIYFEDRNTSPMQRLWLLFKERHPARIGLWLFLSLLVLAILAPLISPYSPYFHNQTALLMPPAWSSAGHVDYMLGTDDLGRDILSRLMNGARLTFGLSIISVLVALFVGLFIGALAGMSSGVKSSFLNHLLDLALSIPSLLIAIIIVAILGPGLANTVWAIILSSLPLFIHATSNAVSDELKKDYAIAYRLDGASRYQVLVHAILPNIFESLIIVATMALSNAILDIAALGFLRLGAQAPSSEWGAMLAESLDLLYIAPWTVALPGILIFISVLSTNLVGDGLSSAFKRRVQS
ncbi:MAG: cationic peptide transport system permease protein [Phenylobacterium sp.]|jgi:cationic peptide transport system permease protein